LFSKDLVLFFNPNDARKLFDWVDGQYTYICETSQKILASKCDKEKNGMITEMTE